MLLALYPMKAPLCSMPPAAAGQILQPLTHRSKGASSRLPYSQRRTGNEPCYSRLLQRTAMAETRKLAAILAADVVGFSRLTGSDEEGTLARLRTLWSDLIAPTIALHHGRVVAHRRRKHYRV